MFAQSNLPTCAFYEQNLPETARFLLIGCGGGSGHNKAVRQKKKYLIKERGYTKANFPSHLPNLPQEKKFQFKKAPVEVASIVSHSIPGISHLIQQLMEKLGIPHIPKIQDIYEEMERLRAEQKGEDGTLKERDYLDMMLDLFPYPTGFLYVALYNVMHKRSTAKALTASTQYQNYVNEQNNKYVENQIYKKLEDSYRAGQPYTDVISTQLMALPGLCEAVNQFNIKYHTKIMVHQYMTDLPTEGAHHFFAALSSLSPSQRQVMYLYGVDFQGSPKVLRYIKKIETEPFAKIFNIDPQNNPMVRAGFRDKKLLDISYDKKVDLYVQMATGPDKKYTIMPQEKIAYIMQGGLAGNDTIGYALELAKIVIEKKCLYSKIFVFNGAAPHIYEPLKNAIKNLHESRRDLNIQESEIIYLVNQDDKHSPAIRVRADAILGGGGLTIMEELTIPHLPQQTILFSSKRDSRGHFVLGHPWENKNVDRFISGFETKVEKMAKTSVQEVCHELIHRKKYKQPKWKKIDKNADTNSQAILDHLADKINYFRSQANTAKTNNLVNAFDMLYTQLYEEYSIKKDKNYLEKNIYQSASIRVAEKTLILLDDLETLYTSSNQIDKKKQATKMVRRYEKNCSRIAGFSFFAKAVLVVGAAILGLILGATIMGGLGFLAGIGPLSIFTTISGFFAGAFTGAGIGFAAASAATGLSAASISGYLLFKPNVITTKVNKVSDSLEAAIQSGQFAAMML